MHGTVPSIQDVFISSTDMFHSQIYITIVKPRHKFRIIKKTVNSSRGNINHQILISSTNGTTKTIKLHLNTMTFIFRSCLFKNTYIKKLSRYFHLKISFNGSTTICHRQTLVKSSSSASTIG